MKLRFLSSLLFAVLSFSAPLNLAADFNNTSRLVSDNVRLNVSGQYENSGQIIGRNSICLNCDALTGNGRIRAPKITIKTKVFNFTGSISCSETCTIITSEPFDEKMFKRKGGGKFEIIVNSDEPSKKTNKSVGPQTIKIIVD